MLPTKVGVRVAPGNIGKGIIVRIDVVAVINTVTIVIRINCVCLAILIGIDETIEVRHRGARSQGGQARPQISHHLGWIKCRLRSHKGLRSCRIEESVGLQVH